MDPPGRISPSPSGHGDDTISNDDSAREELIYQSREGCSTSIGNVVDGTTTSISGLQNNNISMVEENASSTIAVDGTTDDHHHVVATAVCVDNSAASVSIADDDQDEQQSASYVSTVNRLSDTACYLTYKDQTREVLSCTAIPYRRSILSETSHQRAASETDAIHRHHATISHRRNVSYEQQSIDYESPLIISSRNVSAIDEEQPDVLQRPPISQAAVWELLLQQGFPHGLATEMAKTKYTYPVRYWIVDNSGSMLCSDCSRLVQCKDNKSASCLVNSTRWQELQESVEYHINLAGLLESETIFRLLNNPGAMVGPQEILVASKREAYQANEIMSRVEPNGVTPLTYHLLAIRERIEIQAQRLRQCGQKAVIVIATDGLPSNDFGDSTEQCRKDFEAALRSLQILPVWIVIRLCSNDEAVVNYYRQIDEKLEHSIEVIGDFYNESVEVFQHNAWLNYAMPLHRCREMGFHHRVFDLLDERSFNKDELLEFLRLLIGHEEMKNAPNIYTDWNDFSSFIAKKIVEEGKHWNPRTKKMEEWIDIRRLNRIYGDGMLGGIRRKISALRS